jgi:hypothetical protein
MYSYKIEDGDNEMEWTEEHLIHPGDWTDVEGLIPDKAVCTWPS